MRTWDEGISRWVEREGEQGGVGSIGDKLGRKSDGERVRCMGVEGKT